MKYKNYIDNHYFSAIYLYFIVCFILCEIYVFLQVNLPVLIISIIMIYVLVAMVYMISNRGYYIDKRYFHIDFGFFEKKFLLKDIKKCYITSNNKFSYATSKKRIAVLFKNKKLIFISPEKMDEFLLKLINKGSK